MLEWIRCPIFSNPISSVTNLTSRVYNTLKIWGIFMKIIFIFLSVIWLLSACKTQPTQSYSDLNRPLGNFLTLMNVDQQNKIIIEEYFKTNVALNSLIDSLETIKYQPSSAYFGLVVNGLRGREGLMVWPTGDFYVGQWHNNKRTGKGHYVSSSNNQGLKNYYAGQWVNDQKHGYGILESSNGYTYKGEFIKDKKQGPGILTWTSGPFSGDVYQGDFVNNLRSGKGVYTWADGSTHKGIWKEGKRQGMAETIWANGQSYEGYYQADTRTGYGVKTWPNGIAYRGMFKDGRAHGAGVKSNSKGEACQGRWENDQLIGQCIAIAP